jgi:hypothetical protein
LRDEQRIAAMVKRDGLESLDVDRRIGAISDLGICLDVRFVRARLCLSAVDEPNLCVGRAVALARVSFAESEL